MADEIKNFMAAHNARQGAEKRVDSLAGRLAAIADRLRSGNWQKVFVDGSLLHFPAADYLGGSQSAMPPIDASAWPQFQELLDGVRAFLVARDEEKAAWNALSGEEKQFLADKRPK